nr:chymotrypsin inhibitor-like [Osmia lignaria]
MARAGVIVLLLIAIIAGAMTSSVGGCGENEKWSKCNGHCDNFCNAKSTACITRCISGCHCAPGYVRNQARACVLPENC